MTIRENNIHGTYGVKPSFLKTFLIHEYGDSSALHVLHKKNELEVVYNKRRGT